MDYSNSCFPKYSKQWLLLCKTNYCNIYLLKLQPMKTRILFYVLIIILFASCARAVTPYQAAHNTYKKCRGMR